MDKIFYLCGKDIFLMLQNIHPSRQNIVFMIIISYNTFVVGTHN
jgi:hypothetical protein